MKTKAGAANKATVDEDDGEHKKIRSSRSKRRHARRSSTESESPPRKRSKKPSKRNADKKSKRSKVSSSSSRRRRRSPSPSPSPSLSSSSPSSVSKSCSTCSSSSDSDRSVSPPRRSQSRDVKKRKDRGRAKERDPRRRKARKSTSLSSTSSSSSSRSRSKSSKRSTKDGATRDKIGKDHYNHHASMSEKNTTDYFDRDEEAVVVTKKGRCEIERYEKKVSLGKIENSPSKNANEAEEILPAEGGSPVAEDLELILRQKALENFRKFRAAAAMAGETDNGATRKEILTDNPHHAGTKVADSGSTDITPFRGQARHRSESPKSEDCGNGKSPWMQKSTAGMSHGAGSPSRILQNGGTDGLTKQRGSIIEATHPTSQPRSPQGGRNSRDVMQRLLNTSGSASSVKQRLGSSAGVSHVSGPPMRIKSVVSIPAREGRDGSITLQRPCENSAPQVDMNKAEGTNGDDRKTSEASASHGSILSSDEGKGQVTEARIEDKDGSEFHQKTFSRMHEGETVEVSYKVHIPKKTPALARRKLQR